MSWFLFTTKQKVADALASAIEASLGSDLLAIRQYGALKGEILKLTANLEELRIEKARIVEERAARDREIEHKIGLERKRQEFEIVAAKRETTVSVREENLKADQQRFAEQLKFHEDRFATEVTYLKDMIGQVLQRVPDVSVNFKEGRD